MIVSIFRHADDEDNLYVDRNGSILPNQDEIFEEYRPLFNASKKYLFITSSKKRTYETALLFANIFNIKNYKIVKSILLRDMDQGKVKIPDGYVIGQHFIGYDIAHKTFKDVVFGNDKIDFNLFYKFGQNTTEVNSLSDYFSECGESYGDFLYRFLIGILAVKKIIDKSKSRTPVVFLHGSLIKFLIELEHVAREGIHPKSGRLLHELRAIKKKHYSKFEVKIGSFYELENIFSDDFTSILKKEVDFLKNQDTTRRLIPAGTGAREFNMES